MSESGRSPVSDLSSRSVCSAAPGLASGHGPAEAADAQATHAWEMAMARAEAAGDPPLRSQPGAPQGLAPEGSSTAGLCAGGTGVDGPAGATAVPGEAIPAEGGCAGATLAHESAGAGVADGSLAAVPGASGGMTQEEFLEYKLRRIALGLEPMVASAEMVACGDLGTTMATTLAQPVSLYVPVGAGPSALAPADRPVSNDQSVSELIGERLAQVQRSEQQAQLRGAEQIALQLHLDAINTPESLPLETLKSV